MKTPVEQLIEFFNIDKMAAKPFLTLEKQQYDTYSSILKGYNSIQNDLLAIAQKLTKFIDDNKSKTIN